MNKIRLWPEGDNLEQKNRYLPSVSFAWEERERKARQRAKFQAEGREGAHTVANLSCAAVVQEAFSFVWLAPSPLY